jgi:surface protein
MFYNCISLDKLPNISKWDTKSLTNISYMYFNCTSLKILPDISEWNTQNVIDMRYMFYNCKSLKNLPEISKWDVSNVKNMSCIFENCNLLNNLPDISNWNTKNVIDMSFMFCYCSSLERLPDISKWDTKNVINMSCMFCDCISLNLIPECCGKNLLLESEHGNYVLLKEDLDNGGCQSKYKDMYFACRGNCDQTIKGMYQEKGLYDYGWESIDELCNPSIWISKIMAFINGMHDNNDLSEDAFKTMKQMFIRSYPYVARNMTTKEKERVSSLLQFGLID